ncbi:MAG: hypothetical protein AB7F98_07385 [Novosphingobium sp.]
MPADYPPFPLGDRLFPYPALHVDLVVLTVSEAALQVLVRRDGDPVYGSRYILSGAFVHECESLEWTAT